MNQKEEEKTDKMEHAYNLCTHEAEGYPKPWGQPGVHGELEVNVCYIAKPFSQETQTEKYQKE